MLQGPISQGDKDPRQSGQAEGTVCGTKGAPVPRHGPESDPPSAVSHTWLSIIWLLGGADSWVLTRCLLISARGWGLLNQDQTERGEGKS